MSPKEATNIIIRLRLEDWEEEKINDFIDFIETHNPKEGEAEKAKKKNRQKETLSSANEDQN